MSFDTEKKTVMVCDDDRDIRQLFGQALKSKYNVILVSSGEDCIDKFIEQKNRGNNNGTKIILISAYNLDYSLLEELEENNYIDYYCHELNLKFFQRTF